MRSVDRVDAGSREDQSSTWLFPGVITAEMHPRGPHLSRPFAIQRVSFHAFYNASREIRSRSSIYDLTVTIFSKRSIVDRFIVTVDRNDRMVTIFRPIYTHVLRRSKTSKQESIKLTVQTPSLPVSLEFFLFLFNFRVRGVVEIEIWLSIE